MPTFIRSTPARLGLTAAAMFMTFATLTRLALLFTAWKDINHDLSAAGALATGFCYDLAASVFAALPWFLFAALLPNRFLKSRAGGVLMAAGMFLYSAILIFIATAEWFFWDEFGARFNFIAVDYLVWTQEVWGNIWQSYPMGAIIPGIAGGAAFLVWVLRRAGWFTWVSEGASTWRARAGWAVISLAAPSLAAMFVSQSALPAFANQFNSELAKNGCWSFFAAFREMEIDYSKWYAVLPQDQAWREAKQLLTTPEETPVSTTDPEDLRRNVKGSGQEKRWNIILVCMESMSGEFMSYLGGKPGLTPNLNRLATQSIFFNNLYATGTRTVRGMEALTLGLPPTPGQAIIYRPEGTNLTTSFTPFLDRGYDCAFLYGGDGRFDFMNRYYSTAGCRIVDAGAWKKEDVTFKTAWGACDEDLFRKTIAEADANHAAGKPFHFFCMTTSNHRPYDFPAGRIDTAARGKRKPAVKYADWALGRFIEDAASHPWFKDTLFVICSDHCAASAGKTEIDVTKYQIPAMIYNPLLVSPQAVGTLASQIDVMPTVFGLLGWNHETLSYGHDLLSPSASRLQERVFVSNYQKLGLLTRDGIGILNTGRRVSAYACDTKTGAFSPLDPAKTSSLTHEATVFYQSASMLFKSGRLKKDYHHPDQLTSNPDPGRTSTITAKPES